MDGKPCFRHEKKHYITPADHAALRQRLGQVMKMDPNAEPDGIDRKSTRLNSSHMA